MRRDLTLIAVIFVIAHGASTLLRGVYWDDWVVFMNTPEDLRRIYSTLGVPFFGTIQLMFQKIGVSGVRAIVFTCFLGSSLCFYVAANAFLPRRLSLICSVLFAIVPFNLTRVAIVHSSYAVSHFAFFFALALFMTGKRLSLLRRAVCLGLFFFSFATNSFLVFYIPLLGLFLFKQSGRPVLADMAKLGLRYADFVLLPPVYWIFQKIFYPRSGSYADYNRIQIRNLIKAPNLSLISIKDNLVELGAQMVALPWLAWVSLSALIVLAWWMLEGRSKSEPSISPRERSGICLFGFLLLFAAVFPYVVVGKGGSFSDWDGRNQLLMAAGFSVFFGTLIASLPKWGSRAVGALLIGGFILIDLRTYFQFAVDWSKQNKFMEAVASEPFFRDHFAFEFDDMSSEMNVFHRQYRFYEYAALFERVFHDQKRYGAPKSAMQAGMKEQFHNADYKLSEFKLPPDDVCKVAYRFVSDASPFEHFFESAFHSRELGKVQFVKFECMDLAAAGL